MNKTYQKAIWKCYWRPLVVLAFDHRVLSLDSTSHLPSNQNKENNPSPEIKPATQKGKKNKNQIFQILIKKIKFFSHTQSTVNIPNNNPIWVQTTFTIYPLSTKQMNPTRTEGNKNNFKLIKGKSL